MRVRILNHDAYGHMGMFKEVLVDYSTKYPVGSVHEVKEFYPDTGEVEIGEDYDCLAPSEYEVVEG